MFSQHGVNSTRQKRENLGLVLRMIATGNSVSRIDISRRIELTKMAVTNIVGELITRGIVAEKEVNNNSSVGRNPVLLDIAPTAPKALSVYISRLELTAIISDLRMNILHERVYELSGETNDTLTEKLYAACDEVLELWRRDEPEGRIAGIGISSIGPLDSAKGIILNPRSFYNVRNYPVCELLSERYGYPAYLNNDMNAAALAENLYGYGSKYRNFVYLGLTTGVGAGIVSQGELFQNRSSFVGEIGHMSVESDGPLCVCGQRGCLELYASIPALCSNLSAALGIEAIGVGDIAAYADDNVCRPVFDDLVGHVSVALTNIVNILDPQCVIIGHEGYYLPDFCLDNIAAYVNSHILAAPHRSVDILRSSFNQNAPLAGSVSCVWQEMFDGRLS